MISSLLGLTSRGSLLALLTFRLSFSLRPALTALYLLFCPGGFAILIWFCSPEAGPWCSILIIMSERSCPVSGSMGGGRCPAGAHGQTANRRVGPRGCSFSGYTQQGDLHAAFDVSCCLGHEYLS